MKKISCFLAFIVVACVMAPSVQAASDVYHTTETIYTEFGEFEIETTTIIHDSMARSSSKSASKVQSVKQGGKEVAEITLFATFGYDGTTAWVVSANGSHTTYDGWSYSNEKITTSGGTATLTATVSKLTGGRVPISISITCSPTGAIT